MVEQEYDSGEGVGGHEETIFGVASELYSLFRHFFYLFVLFSLSSSLFGAFWFFPYLIFL